jgi:mono/diheme cytochrome c family protein
VRSQSFFVIIFTLLGCQPALERQPKLKDYAVSGFFSNQSAARQPVPGTLPYQKKSTLLPKVSKELLVKGQEKYNIFCSACHGYTGHGDGMAVKRGFPTPVSFQTLTGFPPEAMTVIMVSGTSNMPSFSAKLSEEERWAIANYIKALQLRERFPKKLLRASDLKHLEKAAL